MIDHEAPRAMLRMAVLSALFCMSSGAMAQEKTAAPPTAEEAAVVVQGPAEPAVVQSEDGVRLNFRGVPLDTVLDELSREAGFTIVREVTVEGRVDVVSHRALSRDEVVELLNSVLNGKGFAAIRNGQVLTIVSREEAKTRNIPVKVAAAPEEIPNSDEMVTQIIPIRYADATQLLENLKPLLASYAVANANESSNAIILTDTQANIRRMAEIVQALDTSISSISSVQVFMLRHADAAETATLLTEIFESGSSDNDDNNREGGGPRFFGRGGFGGEGEEPKNNAASPAREAVSRVVAVAETRTNSIVVAAPEELMETIKKLVGEIDTVSGGDVQIRVFTLRFAGAEETAELIQGLFEEAAEEDDRATQTPRFFGPGGPFGGPGGRGNATTGGTGQNAAADAPVNAKPDLRTNSVVVSAPAEVLDQIAEIVRELDHNPAKKRQVYVYSLKNSDPESVAAIVQGMFESSGSGTSSAGNLRGSTGTTTSTGTNSAAGGQNTGNSNANSNAGTQSRF